MTIFQGVNEIVRGADLIEPTVRQISLYQLFGWPVPDYIHLPLVVNEKGMKLSKQNHAPALPTGDPRPVLINALQFLNQDVTHELAGSANRGITGKSGLPVVAKPRAENPAFSNASR
ncbi:Glutamyl-Q tRNA(Asp) synthetase [Leclercia adecarboxylata]|uniref:Glutamyl-Q tRNA(Asp) synthetase n=1 Tax=Leclercia adecarboxylata TaxID=83655 RepID=A0A4U9HJA8_9ENTR|nr:Glutamyl-Q tRNA(Asp) synthetase [Leclercia adecarboxylata]